MIVVEIKQLSEAGGMELLHFLKLAEDGSGDEQLASYVVTHFAGGGPRQPVLSHKVKHHPSHHGALELVRRALNEARDAAERTQRNELHTEEHRLEAATEGDGA